MVIVLECHQHYLTFFHFVLDFYSGIVSGLQPVLTNFERAIVVEGKQ